MVWGRDCTMANCCKQASLTEHLHRSRCRTVASEMASIRTKALSRTESSCAVFVTPRVGQSWVEDQEAPSITLNHRQ